MRENSLTARLPLPMLVTALLAAGAAEAASVYPPGVSSRDVPALLQATEYVRSLDDATLRAMVPVQSGLYFVGWPNATADVRRINLHGRAIVPTRFTANTADTAIQHNVP